MTDMRIPGILNDTLSLVQLARESALAQGKNTSAQKLTPVVNDLRTLVTHSKDSDPGAAQPTGVMAQNDFKTLLSAAKTNQPGQHPTAAVSQSDRHLMVNAMAAGKMSDIDIARQMGMSREEVALILSVSQKGKSGG